jgi:hypothetical protein
MDAGRDFKIIQFTNRVHSLFGVALQCSDSLPQHALIEPQIAAISQHAKALVEQHPARGNITGQKTSDFLMSLTRREHRCHRFLKPRMVNCSGMPSSSTGRDGRSIAHRFPRLPGFHRPGSVPRRLNGRLKDLGQVQQRRLDLELNATDLIDHQLVDPLAARQQGHDRRLACEARSHHVVQLAGA